MKAEEEEALLNEPVFLGDDPLAYTSYPSPASMQNFWKLQVLTWFLNS